MLLLAFVIADIFVSGVIQDSLIVRSLLVITFLCAFGRWEIILLKMIEKDKASKDAKNKK